MSTLELYRQLVPEHATQTDDTVSAWLGVAARRHSASAFGAVFADAMVMYAAHFVQRNVIDAGTGGGAGPVISQTDGDLSRTYAAPAAGATDGGLSSTAYGQAYLDLRDSRAATAPFGLSSRAVARSRCP